MNRPATLPHTNEDHDQNYYEATAGFPLRLPALRGETETDVCIVGAGFTGLSTAHFLKESGVRVVVLEQRAVGGGASGRNGGQVLPGFFADMRDVFASTGPGKGRRLWDLSVDGVGIVRTLIQQYGIACDWQDGGLTTAGTKAEEADLEDLAAFLQENCGAMREFWDRAKVTEAVGNPSYRRALYDAGAGHFHTLKYVRGLARGLHGKDVRIYENTPAQAISTATGKYRITTPRGVVNATALVLCGDSYLGTLVPEIRRKYVVINNSILATEPLRNPDAVLSCRAAVSENSSSLHFYRKTADGRLLFGGGDTVIPGPTNQATQAKILATLRRNMVKLFPALKGTAVAHEWSGSIAVTSSFMPNVGRLRSGIYYANGFSGHGVNLTHVSGKLLADAITKDDKTYRLFGAVKNMSFPGSGRLDYPLTVLGMWRYRLTRARAN